MITFLLFKSNILTHSTQHTAHSTQHTAHSTQHTAHSNLKKFHLLLIFLFMNFLPIKSYSQVDTFACDNGGFEQDFTYYRFFLTNYQIGSNDCSPTNYNSSVSWLNWSAPNPFRFEIVNSGVDQLVGINKTKFGEKALLLNNKYGTNDPCYHDREINKMRKRFKVTAENRELTVWYAAVLENALVPIHINNQPFFSITCDLAPLSNLCFDAAILPCEQNYVDSCNFDPIDVVNWTCHRIKIPESEIGNIATIEISAADCGLGCHFGYAYIDGFCESCQGSAQGYGELTSDDFNPISQVGIKRKSCDGQSIQICAKYELPTVCGNWVLDHIDAPGFTINNISIDHSLKTVCFDVPISNFAKSQCRELFTNLYFKYNNTLLPAQPTNSINICLDDFELYDANYIKSGCYNNSTNDNISDDYYYVNISLSANQGDSWSIERQLDNPYPNESGLYIMKSGTGSSTFTLGPILIQEGSWLMTININGCVFNYQIEPPEYCSGCDKFFETNIKNVQCTTSVVGDTWSFDVMVPGNGTFKIKNLSTNLSQSCSYGNLICTIQAGIIGENCITFELQDDIIPSCITKFTVCPPKPCSSIECNTELFVKEVFCNPTNYSVNVEIISGTNLCYKAISKSTSLILSQGNWPINGNFGPFTEDIFLSVYKCLQPDCFKMIYIPKPDCSNPSFREGGSSRTKEKYRDEISIIPNPIQTNILNIESNLVNTDFEIFNSSGKTVLKGKLNSPGTQIIFNHIAGLYILKYINSKGENTFIKFIK